LLLSPRRYRSTNTIDMLFCRDQTTRWHILLPDNHNNIIILLFTNPVATSRATVPAVAATFSNVDGSGSALKQHDNVFFFNIYT
jgi:hypothetical protein